MTEQERAILEQDKHTITIDYSHGGVFGIGIPDEIAKLPLDEKVQIIHYLACSLGIREHLQFN